MENNFRKIRNIRMTNLEQKILKYAQLHNGIVTWANYINFCLYDDSFGYYKKNKIRVGNEGDFYTSASLKNKIFGDAIKTAAYNLLQQHDKNPHDFEIVEIGAEPEYQMLKGSKVIRLGDNIKLDGNLIVISNELLDARPFERFRFVNNKWQKRAISFESTFQSHKEILIQAEEYEIKLLQKYFPKAQVEDFNIDISFDALELFKKICSQNWNGILIFADYFRSAEEISLLPMGTARTYANHHQDSNFFDDVGNTDITFSPCYEMFEDIAKNFAKSSFTKNQGAFIVEYAGNLLENIITKSTDFTLKRELTQLISSAHMGACFSILTAI